MQQSLVASAPNIDARITQRNRSSGNGSSGKKSGGAGASGRLHRNDAGDWVWSSDDEDEDNSNGVTSKDRQTLSSKSSTVSPNSTALSQQQPVPADKSPMVPHKTINMVISDTQCHTHLPQSTE